jgi:hypothetical protein
MTTKTKKILAVACWLMVVLAKFMLTEYNVIESGTVLSRIIDALIIGAGGFLGCWIWGKFNIKEKE